MIRVLHITQNIQFCGGIQTYIMNYYRHIDRRKIQFDFYTFDATEPSLKEEIEKLGGRVFLRTPVGFHTLKKCQEEFDRFLDDHPNYQIIHCHMANGAFLYLRAAKKHGVPVRILHSHQNRAADIFSHALRNIPLIGMGKHYCNQRLACSKLAGDWLFRGKPYAIVRNAIEAENFVFNSETRNRIRIMHGTLDDTFVIGFVGRLCAQKNVTFALDVMYALSKKKQPFSFWIVGDGEQREMLQQKCQELSITDSVKFLGSKSNISDYYMAFDAFLLPSLYEGLGIVNIEAQASGLHCLVSETVPKEAFVSNLIESLPLSVEPEIWAKKLATFALERNRADMRSTITKARYNIVNEAQHLERMYMKMEQKYGSKV